MTIKDEKINSNVFVTGEGKRVPSRKPFWIAIIFLTVLLIQCFAYCGSERLRNVAHITRPNLCPQVDKVAPSYDEKFSDLSYFRTSQYSNHSLNVWRNAVRIPTSNQDDFGKVGEDSRWDIFYNFSDYLTQTFPKVASSSDIKKVNTHGLVFKIQGSNKDLKPILLAGHQDVVPVPEETLSRWTYPPFEGVYDDEYLWGRGTSDCKNNVVAIFEALEELLKRGFLPRRTILIALGFDEETSGKQGASYIGKYLAKEYGEKSIFMIVDEGGLGVQDVYGSRFALPSTGEKGYIDVEVDLTTVGGHSSVPPRHTSIGIIAELITEIEKEDYPLDISSTNPYFYQLQCEANSGKTMGPVLRSEILALPYDKSAKKSLLDKVVTDLTIKALVSTTQAIDIISGGLKINALPEKVVLKINHRVSYESSLDSVRDKISELVTKVADKYNLDVDAFGKNLRKSGSDLGKFVVSDDSNLIPAPTTDPFNNPTWKLLGNTIRHVFEDFAEYPDTQVAKEITVSPSVMTGNTDTRYYWNLTDSIYRFTPIRQNKRFNAHAVDERVSLSAHIEGVVFFYELIRSVDAHDEQQGSQAYNPRS